MDICALGPGDKRLARASVAGPTALLVAKLHKLGERQGDPDRLVDKDAHDVYRLFVATETPVLETTIRRLLKDELAAEVTREALDYLRQLFGSTDSLGSVMAGRAELGVGDPGFVAVSSATLGNDLLEAVSDLLS